MRSSPRVLSSLVLALSLTLGACSGAPDASSSGDEATESTESALIRGGGPVRPLSYSCDGRYCTCTGDPDCNDMFSDGVCGPSAICQINSYDIPRCRCSVALRSQATAAVAETTPIFYAQ